MDARRRNSREEARQTLLLWYCMERIWSGLTPRYFTEVLYRILLTLMFAELQSTQLRRDEVTKAITSVLSVFNMSLLLFIQNKTSSIHVWMPVCTEENSEKDFCGHYGEADGNCPNRTSSCLLQNLIACYSIYLVLKGQVCGTGNETCLAKLNWKTAAS